MRHMLLILGAVAVLVVGGVALYQWRGEPPPAAPAATAVKDAKPAAETATPEEIARTKAVQADDLALGKADAPVTVFEYASLTCPHCREFHEKMFPAIKTAYVDTGKVRFVMRDFPLDKAALAAAMVARCAGPDRRFAMISLFFNRQEGWAGSQDPISAMAKVAGLAGMSEADVSACLKNDTVQHAVLDQRLLAEKVFDVDATPTFIINGTKHPGEQTLEEFKAIVDPLLAKSTTK